MKLMLAASMLGFPTLAILSVEASAFIARCRQRRAARADFAPIYERERFADALTRGGGAR